MRKEGGEKRKAKRDKRKKKVIGKETDNKEGAREKAAKVRRKEEIKEGQKVGIKTLTFPHPRRSWRGLELLFSSSPPPHLHCSTMFFP